MMPTAQGNCRPIRSLLTKSAISGVVGFYLSPALEIDYAGEGMNPIQVNLVLPRFFAS